MAAAVPDSLWVLAIREWIFWDSDPGTFGYEPTAVTNSAKDPCAIPA